MTNSEGLFLREINYLSLPVETGLLKDEERGT